MLTMIAAINEFERTNLLKQQCERIAIAKRNGVYKGRKTKQLSDFPDFDEYYQQYICRKLTKTQYAKKIGISSPTLDRLINSYINS